MNEQRMYIIYNCKGYHNRAIKEMPLTFNV